MNYILKKLLLMKKLFLYLFLFFLLFNIKINSFSSSNFFKEAKKLYDQNKIEKSKFLLHRNIVFNPKHSKSYLYLAKIYKDEENDSEFEKNLNTTLLLNPKDE